MSTHAPLNGKLLTKPFIVMLILVAIALAILIQRFIFGLGDVTNLNGEYAWGIWVVIDVMVGTAFGCAGYSIALVVYLLNKGEYHPLVRPALLAGLFGYALAGMAAVIDLGRYWQFYTLLTPWYWNFNSVMLEVSLCVMAYTGVLFIEFSPVFLEKFGFANLRKKLSKLLFIFIAIGILLPTMHQSSLGTMAVVFGHQVSPLWQTQLLPAFFLISAMLMGFAIVPFEGVLAALGFHRPMETDLFGKLTRFILAVLAFYLVLRILDLTIRGAWGFAFAGTLDALMFWLEMLLFVLPLFLLGPARNRRKLQLIFISAMSLLSAGTLIRINTYLIGYHPAEGWQYFPSVAEIMVTVGIFSLEVVLYLIFVKRLPVLHKAHA